MSRKAAPLAGFDRPKNSCPTAGGAFSFARKTRAYGLPCDPRYARGTTESINGSPGHQLDCGETLDRRW